MMVMRFGRGLDHWPVLSLLGTHTRRSDRAKEKKLSNLGHGFCGVDEQPLSAVKAVLVQPGAAFR